MEWLEINGIPPDLVGRRCDAILCQSYWHGGQLVEPVNVAFLNFDGQWHRLYFDCGIVFWRKAEGEPKPFEAPEIDAKYLVVDVAQERGLSGLTLRSYEMELWGAGGTSVILAFESGVKLTFRSEYDVVTYV